MTRESNQNKPNLMDDISIKTSEIFPITTMKFDSVAAIRTHIHNNPDQNPPETILWGLLEIQGLSPEKLTQGEQNFVCKVGLGIITTWMSEAHTNPEIRKRLLKIAKTIDPLQDNFSLK